MRGIHVAQPRYHHVAKTHRRSLHKSWIAFAAEYAPLPAPHQALSPPRKKAESDYLALGPDVFVSFVVLFVLFLLLKLLLLLLLLLLLELLVLLVLLVLLRAAANADLLYLLEDLGGLLEELLDLLLLLLEAGFGLNLLSRLLKLLGLLTNLLRRLLGSQIQQLSTLHGELAHQASLLLGLANLNELLDLLGQLLVLLLYLLLTLGLLLTGLLSLTRLLLLSLTRLLLLLAGLDLLLLSDLLVILGDFTDGSGQTVKTDVGKELMALHGLLLIALDKLGEVAHLVVLHGRTTTDGIFLFHQLLVLFHHLLVLLLLLVLFTFGRSTADRVLFVLNACLLLLLLSLSHLAEGLAGLQEERMDVVQLLVEALVGFDLLGSLLNGLNELACLRKALLLDGHEKLRALLNGLRGKLRLLLRLLSVADLANALLERLVALLQLLLALHILLDEGAECLVELLEAVARVLYGLILNEFDKVLDLFGSNRSAAERTFLEFGRLQLVEVGDLRTILLLSRLLLRLLAGVGSRHRATEQKHRRCGGRQQATTNAPSLAFSGISHASLPTD
ncbi:MAG: hypothetical protein H0U74_21790 [Bradymonadaceae bacterium]|nr:hypothetical protein [Lujinxingiaceae bacterium]